MSRRLPRPARAAALVLAGTLALSACGGSDDSEADASTGGGGFPLSLKSTYGTATIEQKPERVATVNWSNQDVALALGVVPVGMPKLTYGDDNGDGILPWTYEALEGLDATGDKLPALYDETDGVDYEAVSDTEPDVILAAYSGLTEEDYTTLSEIAPTVSFPKAAWGTSWRDTTLVDGKALGLEDEAKDLVADVEDQIAAETAKQPSIKGKTFAFAYLDPQDKSKVSIYTPLDSRVQFVEDLGMVVPDFVEDADNGTDFYVDISAENADTIDADVLITYGDESTAAALKADPLMGKIPAVQNDAMVVLEDGSPLAAAISPPTALSAKWALPEYVSLLGAAAAKVQ